MRLTNKPNIRLSYGKASLCWRSLFKENAFSGERNTSGNMSSQVRGTAHTHVSLALHASTRDKSIVLERRRRAPPPLPHAFVRKAQEAFRCVRATSAPAHSLFAQAILRSKHYSRDNCNTCNGMRKSTLMFRVTVQAVTHAFGVRFQSYSTEGERMQE